mmetsp:Transcript_3411/g.10684  ORF Transcript_3411/g.10684 Transcript_3411/m.10684 type:complete len:287 (+) Transcript_3411:409-1269(+)
MLHRDSHDRVACKRSEDDLAKDDRTHLVLELCVRPDDDLASLVHDAVHGGSGEARDDLRADVEDGIPRGAEPPTADGRRNAHGWVEVPTRHTSESVLHARNRRGHRPSLGLGLADVVQRLREHGEERADELRHDPGARGRLPVRIVRVEQEGGLELHRPHQPVRAHRQEGARNLHRQVLQAPGRAQFALHVHDLEAYGHCRVHDRSRDVRGRVTAGNVTEAHGQADEAIGGVDRVVPPGRRTIQIDEDNHGCEYAFHDQGLPSTEAGFRPEVHLRDCEAVESQRCN